MKSNCLFLLSSFLFSLAGVGAGAISNVSLGSIFHPKNSSFLSSPNKIFSIGFISDPQNPSLFLVAITYTGGVPIWSSGGGVDPGGTLQLLSNGNLRLANGSGATVWESGTAYRGVTAATLDESGNLKLTDRTGFIIWQTFDNPLDTIVESQNFTFGMILRSRSYSFTVLNTGKLTLVWNDSITYYNSGLNSSFTSSKTLDSPSILLQKNGILVLSDGKLSAPVNIAYSSNYGEIGDMLRFLRLDKDGNLRAYSVSRGSVRADIQWSAVADQCQVFGCCGNMGICSYQDSTPVCGCPSKNFEPVDLSDSTQGCRRKTKIQDCPGNTTMLEMENTKFLTYPPELSSEQFFVGITACRLNCLSGSSCVASTSLSDGSGLCYLKVSNSISGYQSSSLPSTSFIKVCAPAAPYFFSSVSYGSEDVSLKIKTWVMLIIALGTIMVLTLVEGVVLWFLFRRRYRYVPVSSHHFPLKYSSSSPIQFSYMDLKCSTNCFKEKLGAGGFGIVYKGTLANGTTIAVKKLVCIEQREKQFLIEISTISNLHHFNLVRLIGFCSEGQHRLLVYEFMKNGSLDQLLFSEYSDPFDWETRYKIAVGAARGIAYLHEECRACVVHRDIKPENILLDENYNAKVSDFGLATRTRALTSVCGTQGYLAPECLGSVPATPASDVYSYGMVLLELVGGRRNFDISEETGGRMFSGWAYEEYDRGSLSTIVDTRLRDWEIDIGQVDRAVRVSLWCIQEEPLQRPLMSRVVQMLEGVIDVQRPPAPKASDSSLDTVSKNSRYNSIYLSNTSPDLKISSSGSF